MKTPPNPAPSTEQKMPPRRWVARDSRSYSSATAWNTLPKTHIILDAFDEYLSRQEHESLLHAARKEAEEARAEVIEHVNDVQRLLAGRLMPGESWQFLTDAWNLNARFLQRNFDAQSRYLERRTPAPSQPASGAGEGE